MTPLDRRWSTSKQAAPRLSNLVLPYPSSLVGKDAIKRRPPPWALNLSKPVLVFSAFGMLSNLSKLSMREMHEGFGVHCALPERKLMGASSCYGKRCRFALRGLILKQLDAARHTPLAERGRRERSCLREARECPEVRQEP